MAENSHNTEDFKVFSLSIEFLTTLYGLFMVIWAFSVSFVSESSSLTSMIPAFIGLPLVFIGIISTIKPTFRKALMHIAVLIGAIAFWVASTFLEVCLVIIMLDYQSSCL